MREKLNELGVDPTSALSSVKRVNLDNIVKVPTISTVTRLMRALEGGEKRDESSAMIAEKSDEVMISNVMGVPGGPEKQVIGKSEKLTMKQRGTKKLSALSLKMKMKKSAYNLAKKPGSVGVLARRVLFPPDRNTRGLGNNAILMRDSDKKMSLVNRRYVRPTKAQAKDQICESDRFIGTRKPKHLFSGKRGIGKADHR